MYMPHFVPVSAAQYWHTLYGYCYKIILYPFDYVLIHLFPYNFWVFYNSFPFCRKLECNIKWQVVSYVYIYTHTHTHTCIVALRAHIIRGNSSSTLWYTVKLGSLLTIIFESRTTKSNIQQMKKRLRFNYLRIRLCYIFLLTNFLAHLWCSLFSLYFLIGFLVNYGCSRLLMKVKRCRQRVITRKKMIRPLRRLQRRHSYNQCLRL